MKLFYLASASISIITLTYYSFLLIRIEKIQQLYPCIVGKRIIWANRILLIYAFLSLIFFAIFLLK